MKNLKHRKKEQLYALWPQMTTLGFVGKIREESFWRSFKGGFGSIKFVYSDNPNKTEITMFAEIRFNELENLKNQSRSHLSDRDKLQTFSFSDEYGYLRGKPFPQKWFFDDETDMDDLAEDMSVAILDTLVPYLEKYSTMERALDFMLEKENRMKHSSIDTTAINVVGMAFILGRNDLDDIISSKTQMLREKGSRNIDEFLRFVHQIKA
ncbi:hypothetical protein HQN89_13080 [Paenibacillus frigoriresistens]|uniref:hypothetical protein n=1 Tax=Paenibacillus alginolyticus TaxID=59839 RepID=UPI0015639AD6|nr:hypothetical protein [Paenibacillus frigoriresistens]NRF91948.1 hypothetical protein [Paenibacillus frigoriresistens]